MNTPHEEPRDSANDAIVLAHFSPRFPDVRPRENVRTFAGWIGAGRCVRKGEHGCKISVIVEKKNEAGIVTSKFVRSVAVFHEEQTRDKNEPEAPRDEAAPEAAPEAAKPPPRMPPLPATNWTKLRDKEQRERQKATAEIARPRLTNTRRRMEQARSSIEEHERTLKTCAIADHACKHQDQAAALGLTTWAGCEAARRAFSHRTKDLDTELFDFLTEATTGKVDTRASEILAATQDAAGCGIDHFPTLPELARQMVSMANIGPLDDVLEPSCGKANILLELASTGAAVIGVEISHNLHKLAKLRTADAKNVTLFHSDFFEYEPGYTFDAVVMNPPFSDDINHVAKAWSLLSPGGRLVAIVGEACFSSSRKKGAYDFRKWLESISATVERLDGADSFEGTNASARLIFATKESEE